MKLRDPLLKQMNFLLLWTGNLVSQLGDKMYSIAMAWWILNISGSPGLMGLYLAAVSLPGILSGIFSGVIIDRVNKKRIIVAMDLIRGVMISGLTFLFFSGQVQVWHVFIVSGSVSIASSFFNPAIISIVPRIIKEDKLHKANSLIQMISGIATILGPILGAFAVSVISYKGAIAINALSYLVSGIFEIFIKTKVEESKQSKKHSGKSEWINTFITDLKQGYSMILKKSILMKVMVFIALGHFFIGTFQVAMPLIADSYGDGNLFFLGFMEIAFGSGYILGALFISRLTELGNTMHNLKRQFVIISLIYIVISGIVFFDFIPILFLLVLLPLIGFSIVIASVYWRTAIQTNCPQDFQGRISSVSSLIGDISFPLSFSLFGYLFHIWSTPLIFLLSGVLLMLVSLLLYRSKRILEKQQKMKKYA